MRRPIVLSPYRLAQSLKDVPLWGLCLGVVLAVGVVVLIELVASALYVVLALMIIFVIAVRLLDRRYRGGQSS